MSETVLESVRELLPAIRERAERTESDCRISDAVVDDLALSGVLSMFRPKEYGGSEADPVDYFAAIRAIASACPSTGWAISLIGAAGWHLACLDTQTKAEVWEDDPNTLVAPSYGPNGRLTPVDGGYRLSGSWKSVPGAEHCSWSVLGALLTGQSGGPVDYAAVVLPRADYQLVDASPRLGLRGAGGKSVVVEDAFVPTQRVYGSAGREQTAELRRSPNVAPLYRLPFMAIHNAALVAPLIGAVEGAYNYHLSRMRSRIKLSHGGRKTSEDVQAYAAVARGIGDIDAATLQVERDLREQGDYATRNEATPMELRLRVRRDQVRGVECSVEAIDLLFKAAGGHSVELTNPIQRAWRDVHTGAAHMLNNVEEGLSLYGRWAYGLGVDDGLLMV